MRTVRRAMRDVWLLVGALAFVVVALVPTAHADAPDAHAYWWQLQSVLGPVLTAPSVPEGGLWVAADPTGAQAVSAVRVAADTGVPDVLTLTVASVSGTPAVVACPATSEWTPADGGPWEVRPDADCGAVMVPGTMSTDGGQLVFPLTALGPDVDVVLLPDSAAGFFSVAFEAPDDSTVTRVSAPPITATTPTPAPTLSPPATDTPAISPPPPAASSGTSSSGSTAPSRPVSPPGPATSGIPARPAVPTVAPTVPVEEAYQPPQVGFSSPVGVDLPDPADPGPAVPTSATGQSAPGARQPAALLAASALTGVWWVRLRSAVAAIDDHPLAPANVAWGTNES